MKLVINQCYGGFGLSPEATLKLWERGGPVDAIPAKDYFGGAPDKQYGLNDSLAKWREYLAKGPEGRTPMFLHVFSPDESLVLHANRDDADRANPILVALVEEMGPAANGSCACLSVVEIPDGTDYEVAEYDGLEHVAEKHRTWG